MARLVAGCSAVAVLLVAGPWAGAPAAAGDRGPRVEVSLHALEGAEAGTVLLAAHFLIEPGWHIYWKNPGDSGLRTELEATVPEGASLGPTLYPGPESWTTEGDILNFGYAGETALFRELRLPESLGAGTAVEIKGEARWLACKERCVRGTASVAASFTVGRRADDALRDDSAAKPVAAVAERMEAFRSRLPLRWADLASDTEGAALVRTGNEMTVTVPGAEGLEFFPEPGCEPRQRPAKGTGERLTLHFSEVAAAVEGVLRVERAGRVRYVTIDKAP